MSTSLLLLFVAVFTTNAYFISPLHFNWNEAREYCQIHCESDLAVVDNNDQLNSIMHLYQNFEMVNELHSNSMNAWIGLYDIDASFIDRDWLWIDNTPFNATIMNVSDNGDPSWNCISIQNGTHLLQPTNCDTTQSFICQSCDGKFNKYILMRDKSNWKDSEDLCRSNYGTHLASIHSHTDYNESQLITNIINEVTWIGLNDYNRTGNLTRVSDTTLYREFIYTDGTTWDFARVSLGHDLWMNTNPDDCATCGGSGTINAPTEDCILLMPDSSGLNDGGCAAKHSAICNMRSELSFKSYWNVIQGHPVWGGINNYDNIYNHVQFSDNIDMVMYGKQWLNKGGILSIDYTFSIQSISSGHRHGIFLNYKNPCEHYYVAVFKTTDSYFLHIATPYIILQHIKIGDLDSLNLNQYYRMSVEVNNGYYVSVSFSNAKQLYVTDDIIIDDTYSGYIGISNEGMEVTAKSLYISGSKVYLNDSRVVSEFNKCPTISPTYNPTEPSVFQTISPTLDPSSYPSEIPSRSPVTFNPTTSRPSEDFVHDYTENMTTALPAAEFQSNTTDSTQLQMQPEVDKSAWLIIQILGGLAVICCLSVICIACCIYQRRKQLDKEYVNNTTANINSKQAVYSASSPFSATHTNPNIIEKEPSSEDNKSPVPGVIAPDNSPKIVKIELVNDEHHEMRDGMNHISHPSTDTIIRSTITRTMDTYPVGSHTIGNSMAAVCNDSGHEGSSFDEDVEDMMMMEDINITYGGLVNFNQEWVDDETDIRRSTFVVDSDLALSDNQNWDQDETEIVIKHNTKRVHHNKNNSVVNDFNDLQLSVVSEGGMVNLNVNGRSQGKSFIIGTDSGNDKMDDGEVSVLPSEEYIENDNTVS